MSAFVSDTSGSVGNWVRLPLSAFERAEARCISSALTFELPPSEYDDKDEDGNPLPVEPIRNYRVDRGDGHVALPLAYGIGLANDKGIELDVLLATGGRADFKNAPEPRDELQEKFFRELREALTSSASGAVFACAQTGTGKTVAACDAMHTLQTTTLVVVPNTELQTNWVREIIRHTKMSRANIGVIGGTMKGTKDGWRDKQVVVAVVNSLAMRDWPQEFRDHFGFAVWDEAHRMPARTFSRSLHKVAPRHRLALTATPTRKDGLTPILTQWFGDIAVVCEAPTMPLEYYEIEYSEPRHVKWHAALEAGKFPLPRLLTSLYKDQFRNSWIAGKAARLRDAGRCVLVVSDRIEHLFELNSALCYEFGVPAYEIGLFAGSRVTGYEKVPGSKKPKTVRVKITAAQRKEIIDNPRFTIILATFAMIKEGVNIPRLDSGIDAMPKGSIIQVAGRCRRQNDTGFPRRWYSIVDRDIGLLKGLARARRNELLTPEAGEVIFKRLEPVTYTPR